MYPIPPHEHLVETRTCKHCQTPFPITDKDMEFYEKISPVFPLEKGGYEQSESGDLFFAGKMKIEGGTIRYLIPPPRLCPDCRQQRRLSFRNERKLYKRKCDATGKDIISIYSPDKPYKVYHQDYWWSDAWDPMDYGRDFDFKKGAMEQMGELMTEVPKVSIFNLVSENCNYTNQSAYNKNGYMLTCSSYNEDCCYGHWVQESTLCFDCSYVGSSQNCYEVLNGSNCYGCFYSENLINSTNCYFSKNLDGCHYCYGCSNLVNKKYHINNKPYTSEEYYEKIKDLLKRGIYKNRIEIKNQNIIEKSFIGKQNENVSGDYLENTKDGYAIFNCRNSSEIRYCRDSWEAISGQDFSETLQSKNSMELEGCGWDFGCFFCKNLTGTNYVIYSTFSTGCDHLFLCIGLRNKQYCILNKQYTKEEYEVLVPRIIEHMMKTPHPDPLLGGDGVTEWGEFFPSSMSPFGYNETVAQEYYPMTREEILGNTPLGGGDARRAEGVVSEISEANPPVSPLTGGSSKDAFLHGPVFNYSDYEPPFPKVEKIIPANKLPDDISKIPDDILNWAIECEVTKKPFRIIPQELAFYRKHNIPIPRRHPDQRHLDRMAQRNPRRLYERLCDCPNCEENAKKSGSYREKEFDFRDPETRSGGLRRKMITTYAPERPETVYCEVCYEREV